MLSPKRRVNQKKTTPTQQTATEPNKPTEYSPKNVPWLPCTSPKKLAPKQKKTQKEIAGAIVDSKTVEQLEKIATLVV